MKCVLIYSFFIINVSGSFYDELQGAMHSVQHGFGKLLSDVVIDVTDTVHCTISAVEHVLTLNGLMKTKSPYGHKCRGGPPPPVDRYRDDPLEHFLKTRDAIEGKRPRSDEIHKSISNINTTLTRALEHHSGRQKMESISKVLKHETDQLTKVSNMLRNELHSISRNVNSELEKFDSGLPSIWSELEERNLKRQIENPILEYIPSRKPDGNLLSPSTNSYSDAKREFDHMRDAVGQITSEDLPNTFRDVAEKEKMKLNHNDDNSEKSIFEVNRGALDQFSPFYDPESKGSEDHQRIIEDALSVIRDSHRTDQLMDELNNSKVGSDVFSAGKNVFNF